MLLQIYRHTIKKKRFRLNFQTLGIAKTATAVSVNLRGKRWQTLSQIEPEMIGNVENRNHAHDWWCGNRVGIPQLLICNCVAHIP